jgi:hypothetical protein
VLAATLQPCAHVLDLTWSGQVGSGVYKCGGEDKPPKGEDKPPKREDKPPKRVNRYFRQRAASRVDLQLQIGLDPVPASGTWGSTWLPEPGRARRDYVLKILEYTLVLIRATLA